MALVDWNSAWKEQSSATTLWRSKIMITDKSEENSRDTVQKEPIHPRFAEMQNRLAIIKAQISKRQASVSAQPLKVLAIDK